jgi:hypothetical protein
MNSSVIIGTGLGVMIGAILGIVSMGESWDTPKLKAMITECQKDLPRSQKCDLVAVSVKVN